MKFKTYLDVNRDVEKIVDKIVDGLLSNDTKAYYNLRHQIIETFPYAGESAFDQMQKIAFEKIKENGYKKRK